MILSPLNLGSYSPLRWHGARRRRRATAAAGAAGASIGVMIAVFLIGVFAQLTTASSAFAQRQVPPDRTAIRFSFAPIVKQVTPAVVNVYVRHRQRGVSSPFADDPFFRRFFGRRLGSPTQRVQNSLGSGVIISPDGIVVTNNHVIKGSGTTEIKVALADRREFDATVILRDEPNDLAVLRIKRAGNSRATPFPYLAFDDSDSLEVGDLVIAIGNPFGVGQTVTSGIISALARSKISKKGSQVFIQTDAAINPGNSGGALVDMSGRLVGINTAIFSRSGGSNGIGFAIPSNLVRLVVNSAISGRKIQRPWLGARLQTVTRDIAAAVGLQRVAGALVTKVHRGGPAARAGLRKGDVITAVDGYSVVDAKAVNYRLTTRGVGNRAEIQVMRGSRQRRLQLVLQPIPKAAPGSQLLLTGDHPLDGVLVSNLNPVIADELGLSHEFGVVVKSVRRRTYAANLGLRSGDLLVSVGGEKIANVRQLAQVMRTRPDYWSITLRRGRQLLSIQVPG